MQHNSIVYFMDIEANKHTGEALRSLREEQGLSQEQLAQTLGRPQSFVSKTEMGERSLRAYEIVSYAQGLGLTAIQVLQRIEIKLKS